MAVFKSGLKKISSDVERCLSLVRNYMNIPYHCDFVPNLTCAHTLQCVEERLRGIISSLIRLSKQVKFVCQSELYVIVQYLTFLLFYEEG